jgi:glycerophosphoryl diester phosphodiesterase
VTIPRVIAHRGSSAAHADNSWGAFEAAVAEGADAIECDVVATREGVLVVRHDLCLGSRFVRELNAAELEAAEPDVIRLSDLLPWAARARIGLLVEVKEPDVTLAAAEMIASSSWRDRIVVGAFHAPSLAAIKATLPRVRTSFMIGSVVGADNLILLARAYRVDGVHLCWEARATRPHRLVGANLIEELQRAHLDVTLWHEERESELRALVALEPDAICTNTPAVLRRIVDVHRENRSKLTT